MKTKKKKAKPRTRRRYRGGWGDVFTSKWWRSVSETMRTHPRRSYTEGYGPQSEIAPECRDDDSQDCLLFGTQIKNVLSFFNNFNLDVAPGGPIRVQWEALGAAASTNGFVSLVKFTRDNVHALAVLKTSKHKKSDNLMYEYRVGTYLNSVCDVFPCFVFTYGIYTGLKPPKTAQPVAIAPDNIVSDFSINAACDPARGVEKLNLLTQFLGNSKPLYSYMEQSERNDALLPVFFQIVYSLVWLNSGGKYRFRHNDLHQNNVLIYELPKPIQFTFRMRGAEPVVFLSRYLAKIIDYGRSKYGLDQEDHASSANDLKEHAAAANCNHTKDFHWTPAFSKTGVSVGFYLNPVGALDKIFFKTKDSFFQKVKYIQDVPEEGKLYYYNAALIKYVPIDEDDARSLYDANGTVITGNNVDGFAAIVSDLMAKEDFLFCQDYMKEHHQWAPTSENPLEHLMGFLAPLVHKPTKPWKLFGTLTVRGPTLEPMVFERTTLSEKPCTVAQNCLLFMQVQRVLSFFNNFNLDKPVPGQTIQWKALQTSGGNADVCVVKYTRDSHDAFALLKKAKEARFDNLMYEYRVGAYLNSVCSIFPCFVYTYGLYAGIQFPKARDFVKISSIGPKNVVTDYSLAAACGARDSAGNASLCLLTQYLEGSVQLEDHFHVALDEIYDNPADPSVKSKWDDFFFPIFFQIAYSLVYLNKSQYFKHNDLHPANVLVYELPYPIEFTFVMESAPPVVFCTKYLAKIIDYGRASYGSEAWLTVTVPAGALPGEEFDLPRGGKVVIPEGVKPGDQFKMLNPETPVPSSTQTDFIEHQTASKRRNQNDKRTHLCNEYNPVQYDNYGFLKGDIYKLDAAKQQLTKIEASYHVTGQLSGLMLKNTRSGTFTNIEDTRQLYSLLQTPQYEDGIFAWQAEPEKQLRTAEARLDSAYNAAKLAGQQLTRAASSSAELKREALEKSERAEAELKTANDLHDAAKLNRKTEKVLDFGDKLYLENGSILPSKVVTVDGFEAIFMQYYSKNDVSFCSDYLGRSKFKNMDELLKFLVPKMKEPDPAERLFGTLTVNGPKMKQMKFVKDGDDPF